MSDRAIHDTIASLVVDGVFHRHPTLRVASIENGSDWVALLVKRLKKQANQTPWAFKEDPLDVIRRNVWVTPYYEEDLRALADLIGVERILFGSDWPHGEGLAEPIDFVKELARLRRRRGAQDHARQRARPARHGDDLTVANERATRRRAARRGPRLARAALGPRPLGRRLVAHRRQGGLDRTALHARAGRPRPAPHGGQRRARRRSPSSARCARPAASACSWPRRRSSRTAPPDQIARLVPPILDGPGQLVPAVQRARRRLRPRRA